MHDPRDDEGTKEIQGVKYLSEEESAGSLSISTAAEERKQSAWQIVLQYKVAIFWSAFIGLAGINWGMDVLVSLPSSISKAVH